MAEEALQHLLQLLQIERDEDRRQYEEQMIHTSLAERRRLGLTWYPVRIAGTGYGVGERFYVELERTQDQDQSHQLQPGRNVEFFSRHREREDAVSSVIQYAGQNRVKLFLPGDELPEWANEGKLGLTLLFDDTTYQEMREAVQEVRRAKNSRLAELRDVLYGVRQAQFDKLPVVDAPHLNESQRQAVAQALAARDVAIIHGPPGTGKTTTLVELIRQTLDTETQVLVCAPSNTAVDLLTERLAALGLRVLRVGNPARVSEDQLQHTVDAQLTTHADYAQVKKLRRQSDEYHRLARQYKRNFGHSEREQRRRLLAEARQLSREAARVEDYLLDKILSSAQVITATPVGSQQRMLEERFFSVCFIDEAAQALEPACWLPIRKAKKVVMAGDPFQLPPTVKSPEAERQGLGRTLIEKAMEQVRVPEGVVPRVDVMLQVQYRMHETIMGFSNGEFYGGALQAAESVRLAQLGDEGPVLEFVDTAGSGFEEEPEPEGSSLRNPEEAALLLRHLRQLLDSLPDETRAALRIGIISPYKAQVTLLRERLAADPIARIAALSVNTVDGFQGQERDIICVSLVRSNERGEVGFLADTRRMNVALTRAKRKLVVIGDSATLSTHPFYQRFLDYVEQHQAYRSAWEWMA
ncbi:AAA domain-containing protein [Catalinimonas alkaloidigena]|nr:AAA domain-containing protein [Catalinimonas alkaloidigena]